MLRLMHTAIVIALVMRAPALTPLTHMIIDLCDSSEIFTSTIKFVTKTLLVK